LIESLVVQGICKSQTIPAKASGNGKAIGMVGEYRYSEEPHLNSLTKYNDLPTGQQIVTITKVDRAESNPAFIGVPSGYQAVDETPEPRG
jgi:hypothetical protein